MCSEYDVNHKGFTLFELLISVSIIVLLAGLTLGALRASRSHQSLEQSGARLRMLTEIAAALARSGGEPVYLAVADMGASPETDERRAFTLIRDLDDPVLLRDWQRLPREVVFAPDGAAGDVDLMTDPPVRELHDPFGAHSIGGVSGPVRVLLRVDPDGGFRVGANEERTRASLTLRRGRWEDSITVGGKPKFVPWWEDRNLDPDEAEVDILRLRFRPLTGVVVSERVYP